MSGFSRKESIDQAVTSILNPPEEEPKEPVTEKSTEESDITDPEVVDQVEDLEEDPEDLEDDIEEDDEELEEDYVEEDEELEEEELAPVDTYTITVDGKEEAVTLDELRAGYQRNKDYTQKTQNLAEQRKLYESKVEALEKERLKYIDINTQALQETSGELQQYSSIDWEALKQEDPMGYLQKQADYMEVQRKANERMFTLKAEREAQAQLEGERMAEFLQEQRQELLATLPEYSDPAMSSALADYAKGVGYTDADLANLVRAKDVLTLHKAKLYDESLKKKVEVSKKKAPAKSKRRVKSSAPTTRTTKKARAVKDKKEALRKTGKIKDAVALMREMRE